MLLVVGLCLVQLLPVEVPLLGAPERTPRAVESICAWVGRRGRIAAVIATAALGAILVVRGLVGAW